MQLYFIRHGQSSNNRLWDETGASIGRSEDPELTEIGQQQAKMVARFLRAGPDYYPVAPFAITRVYTSLMVRAVATGAAIVRELGVPLIAWEELHEGGGIYLDSESGGRVGQLGKTRAYFAKHYPELVLPQTLLETGWWNRRAYEEEAQAMARATRVAADLRARHGNTADHIAVVSHGAFYNFLLRALFGFQNGWFEINNTGITRIDFRGDNVPVGWSRTALIYANRVDFLPAELVT